MRHRKNRRIRDENGNNEIDTRNRKKKLSTKNVGMLQKFGPKYRFKTQCIITAEFKKCPEDSLSISMVRKALQRTGMLNYVAGNKLFLSTASMKILCCGVLHVRHGLMH